MAKKKTEEEQKPKLGAPTLYKEEYAEQAYKLCLLGAIDKQLADFFEVDVRTIDNWKKAHPVFFQSIKRGKQIADAVIAESLYGSAKGHTVKEVTYERLAFDMTPDNDDEDSETETEAYKKKVVIKEVSPNPTSAIFWLKNRQPALWRDKQEVEHSGDLVVNWHEVKNYDEPK